MVADREIVNCCICKKPILKKYANDPYPVNKSDNAYCCDSCNMLYVVPARLNAIGGTDNAKEN